MLCARVTQGMDVYLSPETHIPAKWGGQSRSLPIRTKCRTEKQITLRSFTQSPRRPPGEDIMQETNKFSNTSLTRLGCEGASVQVRSLAIPKVPYIQLLNYYEISLFLVIRNSELYKDRGRKGPRDERSIGRG